jgi:hypothetical protein
VFVVLEVQEAWHVTDRMRGKSRAEKALAIPGAAAESTRKQTRAVQHSSDSLRNGHSATPHTYRPSQTAADTRADTEEHTTIVFAQSHHVRRESIRRPPYT